ncbi:MAG: SDR family NAD(P)-dependent oxidoreductase [Lunatimonas sp.]|uniref:SDR family NAD(P)-dependent oxidoreductase n=1 Tax=Lunatimonas sp. TaxID=2060141 RepID=UPI00263A8795|nr:SDR family NAD(P)-dependent oxidoreductase [Lunatimonas sp.]MCC5939088.1 SDR family NAD(P)-dependent oxidoreductase [Lunatimonas sp.]
MQSSLYIVTGSSKGLGRALVEILLERPGVRVVGVSRSEEKTTDRFFPVQVDLKDTQSLIGKLDQLFPSGDFQRIALINNAGWIGEIGPMGDLSPQGIADIHLINTVAPAILTNAFIQKYRECTAEKVVINVSSGAAKKAVDGWSGYCSSKAALNQFTLVAQEESDQKGYGIRYIALSPGIIDTPMQGEIRSAAPEKFSQLEKFKSFKATNQLSTPSETAAKVSYLLDHLDELKGVLLDVREF